ncbi:MAG: CocE/NonD family hydrolase, partial [Anaerolineae bacterium]|nr:CocE/NonD family hydrolase [Anaerolineae bacterium]
KALIGPWVHAMPHQAYPGPNIDWLHEMVRFFDYWLKGIDNGVMAEPPLTIFRQEYTPPEPFPERVNGCWHSEVAYPIARTQFQTLFLNDGILQSTPPEAEQVDVYPHRPTLGTQAGLCWGGGSAPNGLARDLRPDEALSLTYTGQRLTEPLDIIGFARVVLYLSVDAPVAHVVVRLADVAPDGTSALVTTGILNLTHRSGHHQPIPLTSGEIYEIPVQLKACGYRFLPGHRLRVSITSAYWPVIWPSPYRTTNYLYCGPAHPSRLILPVVPIDESSPTPPIFKTSPPEIIEIGSYHREPPTWQIIEDVIDQSVTVKVYGGDTTELPDGRISLFNSELLELTAYHHDPAYTSLYNEVIYHLKEHNYETRIRATGTIRSTESDFHIDVQLQVSLNDNPFFQKSWLESIPRQWL